MTDAKFAFPRHGRTLRAGQTSELRIVDADGGNPIVVLTTEDVIEAPNWTVDGQWLIFNAGGQLFRISPEGGTPEGIDTGPLHDLNNDHVLSPDGSSIYVSSDDGHIYVLPITGGTPQRVSNQHPHRHHYYLHGISPDGSTLVYTCINANGDDQWGKINIWTIPSQRGEDIQLTDVLVPNDGAEYSPDGEWIWFNSEIGSPGHAQIFKMRTDGSELTQITHDERVNWFPHFAPDGQIVYLSYPAGTQGHPEDKDVILRTMTPEGKLLKDIAKFNGGQGTINVNSWSPDSKRLAYVAYPLAD